MAWPKGKSRKEYFAEKAAKKAEQEVVPPEAVHSSGDNAQPASQFERSEMRARNPQWAAMKAAPKSKTWTMKAGNNWDSAAPADESPDELFISRDEFPEGMDLFWATRTLWGQPMTQQLNGYYRAGWTPVHHEDFDGRFANRWGRDDSGYVVKDAAILCARPLEMSVASKKRELAKARDQITLKEQAFKGGEMPATGADHPSAKAHNRITRTLERLDIPRD